MNNELTKLIKEEIDRRYKSIKDVSNKVRELQRVYNALVPSKNKKHVLNAEALTTEDLYFEFIAIINKYNYVLYKELEDLIFEAKVLDIKSLAKSNPEFSETPSVRINRRVKDKVDYLRQEAEIGEKMRDFFAYAMNYVAELYEKLYEEKERKKDERKVYEWSLKDLNKNNTLTPKEIKAITELIESSDVDKNKYYDLLNKYIKQKEESASRKKDEKEAEISKEKKQIIYSDKENYEPPVIKEDNVQDILITNYVTTIYTLQNDKKSLKEFLDGLSYNEDFEDIISKIMIIISENGKTLLCEILKDYQKELFNQEEIIEADNDEITVLYYGFLQNKEKVLNDIEKTISFEDYKDVLKGLEQIKLDGAVNGRKNIVRIRKVFKLRVNNIRVTFKRISKNVYIVLGVYRKKDNHGAEIIFSTERRNNYLLRDEKQISDAIKIPELWNSYLEKNNEIEENIFKLLKEHIYSV